MRRLLVTARLLPLVVFAVLAGVWPMAAQAGGGGAGGLGRAANFAVLADSTGLTCTDSNVMGTPVGVASKTTPVTSTRCHMNVRVATGAYNDFVNAYNVMAGNLTPCTVLTGTLDGQMLGAGKYCFSAAATLTGTLTLMGTGPWLFEIGTGGGGALTATNFKVVGSRPCNATWWVRDAVTLKTSAFQGAILAGADITLTGTTLAGRAFAKGAVTMTGSNVFGCNASGTIGKHHQCDPGEGDGQGGGDRGDSSHRQKSDHEHCDMHDDRDRHCCDRDDRD